MRISSQIPEEFDVGFSQLGSLNTSWSRRRLRIFTLLIMRKLRLNSDGHAGGREAPRMCITNSTEVLHD